MTPVASGALPPPADPESLVLLGHPVAHSLSPRFQQAALTARGLRIPYAARDVAPSAVAAALAGLRAVRAAGNATVPHKAAVAAACDVRSPLADRLGAVNTWWHAADGALVGVNTDVAGAAAAIAAVVDPAHAPERVLLLGAGGSAVAVVAALAAYPDASIGVHARTPARVPRLAERAQRALVTVEAAALASALREADLVINATPLGLDGAAHPAPLDALGAHTAVLDLVYRPGGTAWVREARSRGLVADDGLRMLVAQGAAAFRCWFGDPVPEAAMWAALEPRPDPRAIPT